ncbi:MAG: M23 family metallopeptidase [Firmicutes bacterium]|jgi:murein DD-endopeptidase MepM/ murein hydrolase activator NlpD|nr:M23 family metallopeptidase [Bacillota bacterium]
MFSGDASCKAKISKILSWVLVAGTLLYGGTVLAVGSDHSENFVPRYYGQLKNYIEARANPAPENKLEIVTHRVECGDTLFHIARKYGTDIRTIISLNGLDNPDLIYPGEELEVLSATGLVHTVQAGETLDEIATTYDTAKDEIIRLARGTQKALREGERLFIPADRSDVSSRSASGASTRVPAFIWPLEGTISSPYGWREDGFHHGLDIAAPSGTPIVAAADGTVLYNQYRGRYGLLVEIEHGEWMTRYAHNSKVLVEPGQKVYRGEEISRVGSTGNSTGPHLHFEVIYQDQRLDPIKYLP